MQDKCPVRFLSGYLQSSVQHAEASMRASAAPGRGQQHSMQTPVHLPSPPAPMKWYRWIACRVACSCRAAKHLQTALAMKVMAGQDTGANFFGSNARHPCQHAQDTADHACHAMSHLLWG